MGDPLFRRQRNKKTGEVRDLMSHDGGQTWMVVPTTEEAPDEAPQTDPTTEAFQALAGLGGTEPGGGMDYQNPAIQRAQMDVAGPSLWTAGKVIAPLALPGGGSLGPIARTALNAAEAGGTSAAISAAEDDRWKTDPHAAAWDALVSGGVGAATGGALSGAMEGVGALAKPIGMLADKARASSFASPAALKASDYSAPELVQEAERLGLFNKVIPQSPADIAARAQGVMDSAGPGYMGGIEAATQEGVQIPRDAILARMQGQLGRYAGDVGSNGAAQERIATDLIDRFASRTPDPAMSPLEAWAAKSAFQKSGGYVSNDVGSLPTGQSPAVNRQFGGIMRDELDRAMAGASPEAQASYNLGRQDFEPAAEIAGMARDRANTIDSRGLRGFGMGNIADQYGMSAAGNALRMGEGLTGFAGRASDIGGLAGSAAGQLAGDQLREQRERITGRSMGHNLPSLIRNALSTDPSTLGKYAPKLQEAYASGDSMAIAGALAELERDDEFRNTVLRQLQDQSNPTGDY